MVSGINDRLCPRMIVFETDGLLQKTSDVIRGVRREELRVVIRFRTFEQVTFPANSLRVHLNTFLCK